jgi:hypothetical protein
MKKKLKVERVGRRIPFFVDWKGYEKIVL